MRGPYICGLIVAMVRIERHLQTRPECLPRGAFAHESVREVAECAMGEPESRADEVRQFATDGTVRVVHADKPSDRPSPVAVIALGRHALHATAKTSR